MGEDRFDFGGALYTQNGDGSYSELCDIAEVPELVVKENQCVDPLSLQQMLSWTPTPVQVTVQVMSGNVEKALFCRKLKRLLFRWKVKGHLRQRQLFRAGKLRQ